jgi:2-phospho-L-lactate guanylyltransferase (CobY/MobA/RfbA family)
LIDFHFGDDSFQPHLAEARRHGCKPAVIYMPDIGLDIDRPDDLAKLIAGPGATRAQAWLNDSGIARRLAAAAGRLEDQ